MSELVVAVGLFLIIEGLIYAIAPQFIRKMALLLPQIPDRQLRNSGLAAMIIGLGLVWLIRG